MFKDYYKILHISQYSSLQEIRSAYRAMSKKWHPDKNPGKNVVAMMQDINEAYAILKDECLRKRYDIEYRRFVNADFNQMRGSVFIVKSSDRYEYNYEVQDEKLKESINIAQELAKKMVKEFLESFQKSFNQATRGAWDIAQYYVYVFVLLLILGVLIRGIA